MFAWMVICLKFNTVICMVLYIIVDMLDIISMNIYTIKSSYDLYLLCVKKLCEQTVLKLHYCYEV